MIKNLSVGRLILLGVACGLAGCGSSQNASYTIDGGKHALAMIRQQEFLGGNWRTDIVVTRFPECQRRYTVQGAIGDRVKVDVYRYEPEVFILNSGKRWFVAETRECGFQQYKEVPPFPGDLVGTFQIKDGKLSYQSKEVAKQGEEKDGTGAAPVKGIQ